MSVLLSDSVFLPYQEGDTSKGSCFENVWQQIASGNCNCKGQVSGCGFGFIKWKGAQWFSAPGFSGQVNVMVTSCASYGCVGLFSPCLS